MRKNGFTLIELIIVIAVIGIMTAIGSITFSSYSRTAKLNAAANELVTTLNVAKSNALSQVKDPTLCAPTDVLNGYKVVTNNDCKTYELKVACGGADNKVGTTKTLPNNVVFTSATQKSFFFPILKGGASGDSMVGISGFGQARCIGVSPQGVISSNVLPCPPSGCIPPTPTPTPTLPPPTPTPTPTPAPPVAKTCTTAPLFAPVYVSALNASCDIYCGAFLGTVTCSNLLLNAGGEGYTSFDWISCSSGSKVISPNFDFCSIDSSLGQSATCTCS